MADLLDLSGKWALVTGASRGIGLAMANGLAKLGAALVITGRKAESLEAAAAALRKNGATVLPIVAHQGHPKEVKELFNRLDKEKVNIEVAIINAATNPIMSSLLDTDLAVWQKILDVNLTGAFVTIQEGCRRMVTIGKGSIILIASVAGLEPIPQLGAYGVSKSGLIGLTKALAKEVGPLGVRVNAIAPGLVETEFAAALFKDEAAYKQLVSLIPLGRHGQPSDIVGAAAFFASSASAYITGQVLVVDGGNLMR